MDSDERTVQEQTIQLQDATSRTVDRRRRMRVAEGIELLRDVIEEIEEEYCSECQECDCDFCCIKLWRGEET